MTITGEREGGNQLTWVGAPTCSQGRTAAATSVVPVAAWVPSEIEPVELPGTRCAGAPAAP